LRSWIEPGLAILLSICILLSGSELTLAEGTSQSRPVSAYSNASWATGVVVPEGAGLQDGGKVHWEGVSNVTVSLTLPDIGSPDRVVYAVMSVMTSDGSVLQAAAGALPNSTGWRGFAWLVTGANSGSPTYLWVLNASQPEMSSMGTVLLSIFSEPGAWELKISDMATGSSVERSYPQGPGQVLRAGDQEVFALESYSRSQATFSEMGNLTLNSIWLDGQKVVSGCYLYSDWDMIHNPLFVVGSTGSSPPSFIYAGEGKTGSFFWDYAGVWGAQGDTLTGLAEILALVALVGAVVLGGTGIWLARKKPANASSATSG